MLCNLPARAAALAFALVVGPLWADPSAYDELPEGDPKEVARLYHSALALPGVASWSLSRRTALLDAATLRYRDRLVNRASWTSREAAQRHVERLAAGEGVPSHVIGQACAQFGLLDGPCEAHLSQVRRTLVLEEMLVQGRLSLDGLEAELVGIARPGLDEAR